MKTKITKWAILILKLAVAVFFAVPYFYNWCYIPQIIEFWFK